MQDNRKGIFIILLTLLAFPTIPNSYAINPIDYHLQPPTVNWPSLVIIGRSFTIIGKTPLPRVPVRARVAGSGHYEGQDYVEEVFADRTCKFAITVNIPYPFYDFKWKWNDTTGKNLYLTVEWGNYPKLPYGNSSGWIPYKTLADYTFEPIIVDGWPDLLGSFITMGKPFTLTGTAPLPDVPVRLEVHGRGPDDGKDYVEEVMSDKECKFTIIAAVPEGYQTFWYNPIYEGGVCRATLGLIVTWGY